MLYKRIKIKIQKWFLLRVERPGREAERSLAIKCRFKNARYFPHILDVILQDDTSTFTQYSD